MPRGDYYARWLNGDGKRGLRRRAYIDLHSERALDVLRLLGAFPEKPVVTVVTKAQLLRALGS